MDVMVFIWSGGQEADEQNDGALQEMFEFVTGLAASGRLTGGGPLRPASEGRTIRARKGTVTVMDGPYAETKEVLAGYFVLHVDSLDEAVQLTEACPGAKYGGVELREIIPMG
ncbi:MAG TPA: YciI family protein [Actinomycetota bacterium]|nr:YciI family protein [Actinomycetota bacterium]